MSYDVSATTTNDGGICLQFTNVTHKRTCEIVFNFDRPSSFYYLLGSSAEGAIPDSAGVIVNPEGVGQLLAWVSGHELVADGSLAAA